MFHWIRTITWHLGVLLRRLAILAAVVILVGGYLGAGLSPRSPQTHVPAQPVLEDLLASNNLPAVQQPPEALLEATAALDAAMQSAWEAAGIEVAPAADWLSVCRRLSLALVGSGMPLEEIRYLQSVAPEQRIDRHLGRLLDDPRFHDYWAERLTRTYIGTDEGPFLSFRRRRFRSWLSESLAANRHFDTILHQLITARGLPTDQPAVNYLTVTMDSGEGQPDPVRLAARTSRAFLGLRMDCLQCHDDFLGNVSLGDPGEHRFGTQQDFHALAAFFAPARFNGLQGIRDEAREYRYEFLGADEEVTVEPAVPFAAELLPRDGTPRQRLAAWLTHPENRQVARCLAARVWALLFGRSLSDAVDDLPLDRPPHAAIEVLADTLIGSGYDLRLLISTIVRSRVYRLDSAADFEITADHEQHWSVFPLVRLRPEQVAGSIIQAARVKTVDRDSSLIVQLMKLGGINDFVTRYGDIGEDEFNQDNVTITQRLLMLNGKIVRESVKAEPLLNASAHINLFSRSDTEAIENAYLCVLNRYPSEEELATFTARMESQTPTQEVRKPNRRRFAEGLRNPSARKPRERVIEDLFWILVNSSEFSWNH